MIYNVLDIKVRYSSEIPDILHVNIFWCYPCFFYKNLNFNNETAYINGKQQNLKTKS